MNKSKLIAAAMTGCLIVTAMAATASAAGYSNPKKPSQGAGYSSSVVYVPESEVKVVTAKLMQASIDSGKTITINSDDAMVNRSAMSVIKKQKEPVVFKSKEYTVSIDPKSITTAKEVNLGIKIDMFPKAGIITVQTAQEGEFGLEMSVTISADSLKEYDLKKLKFFYEDKDGKRRELKDFSVNKDGSLTFTIARASSYVFEQSK